eukprot:5854761-Prymnesium_polylepis.1
MDTTICNCADHSRFSARMRAGGGARGGLWPMAPEAGGCEGCAAREGGLGRRAARPWGATRKGVDGGVEGSVGSRRCAQPVTGDGRA